MSAPCTPDRAADLNQPASEQPKQEDRGKGTPTLHTMQRVEGKEERLNNHRHVGPPARGKVRLQVAAKEALLQERNHDQRAQHGSGWEPGTHLCQWSKHPPVVRSHVGQPPERADCNTASVPEGAVVGSIAQRSR
jgi:hypothetical protein